MNEATATIIVAGSIQIIGMITGFLTLWVKLRYSAEKAEEAAAKAKIVENKLDANTLTTNAVDTKTDTIVAQTDGAMDRVHALVTTVSERVSKLEDQNRERGHRLLDALHGINLKVERLLVVHEVNPLINPSPPEHK